MHEDSDNPLLPVVSGWIGKVDRAIKAKSAFDEVAKECMLFFAGPHNFMWKSDYKNRPYRSDSDIAPPEFQMSVNKVFELVALFGPVLYHSNPVRRVTPRQLLELPQELFVDPMLQLQLQQMQQFAQQSMMSGMQPDPMLMVQYQQMSMMLQQQQMQYSALLQEQTKGAAEDRCRAQLMELMLNHTPNELDLATHAQDAITEALIKGRGTLWCSTYQAPESDSLLVGAEYDSVDNLVIDPDAERLEDAQWVARRCVHPVWQVERDYGLQGMLERRGNLESAWTQGESQGDDLQHAHRQEGRTNDLLVYWKIWSRMGMGGRMTGAPEELKDALELLGDNCYIVVAKGIPFPLNMPSAILRTASDDELKSKVAWPIPFWRDNRWPFREIDFYKKPRSVWPISPISPGLGELLWINWAMSFLAGHIRITCRDFIVVAKAASEEIKNTIAKGRDLTVVEIEAAMHGINNVVQFLQHPPANADVWHMIDAVLQMFDKRVGLSDLLYGMTTRQIRSAAEAGAKQENISIRPDHMAAQVEKAMTELARMEGLASRWMYEPMDVIHVVGPVGAQLWQTLVMDSDVNKVARELEFRVEAGSVQKPNYARDASNMGVVTPALLPILQGYAATSNDYAPLNWVIDKWGKSIQQDMSGAMMKPIPLPQPMPVEEEQPKEEKPVA